jgi:hypothetical protein
MNDVALLIPILCSLGFFAMVAVIVISAGSSERARARLHAETQARLIDRFAAGSDLNAFLVSPIARELLDPLEAPSRTMARTHILQNVRTSTVFLVLGAVCFLFTRWDGSDWLIPGWILLSLGIAYAASTAIALRLSRAWGLLGASGSKEPSGL